SGRDIARALGVSEAAARQLVLRARARARAAVSGLVPPALIARLPASGGRGARRALALVHGGLANASPMEASEALARLAPVLAAVVLVTAPVAAVELSGHRCARATEALAPAAAATQDAGRRVSGAEGLLPQPPGGLEALQPRPPQAAPGASAPIARTLP